MPEFGLILGVVIFFALALLIFLTAKTLLHSLSLVLILLFLVSAAGGFFVIKDALELKDRLSTSDNLVVLADNNKAVTGFVLSAKPAFLSDEFRGDVTTALSGGKTKGDYYKIFIVDAKILDEQPGSEIEFSGKTYKAGSVKDALLSDDTAKALGVSGSTDPYELRAALFSSVFVDYVMKDPLLLFGQYKKGNIRVEPETAVFKFMKFAPVGLLKTVVGSAFNFAEKKSGELEKQP